MWNTDEEPNEVASTSERIFCPVCKTRLGSKKPEDFCSYHCDECRATYQYYPGNGKPKAILDKEGRVAGCGCGKCGR